MKEGEYQNEKMKLLLGVAAAVFMLAAPASAKAVEVPAVSSYSGETVSAQAVKHGLIIKGNKITYWYKGRQAKNCWKKWEGNRYYFKPERKCSKRRCQNQDWKYICNLRTG